MGTTVRMILAASMLIAFPAQGHAQESDAREERAVLANDSVLREAVGAMPRQNARAPIDYDSFPSVPRPTINIVTPARVQFARESLAEYNTQSKKIRFIAVGRVYFGPVDRFDRNSPEQFMSNINFGPRALNMEHPAPVGQTWIALYFCKVEGVERIRFKLIGISNSPGPQEERLTCS